MRLRAVWHTVWHKQVRCLTSSCAVCPAGIYGQDCPTSPLFAIPWCAAAQLGDARGTQRCLGWSPLFDAASARALMPGLMQRHKERTNPGSAAHNARWGAGRSCGSAGRQAKDGMGSGHAFAWHALMGSNSGWRSTHPAAPAAAQGGQQALTRAGPDAPRQGGVRNAASVRKDASGHEQCTGNWQQSAAPVLQRRPPPRPHSHGSGGCGGDGTRCASRSRGIDHTTSQRTRFSSPDLRLVERSLAGGGARLRACCHPGGHRLLNLTIIRRQRSVNPYKQLRMCCASGPPYLR